MCTKQQRKSTDFFASHPVFSLDEAVTAMAWDGGCSRVVERSSIISREDVLAQNTDRYMAAGHIKLSGSSNTIYAVGTGTTVPIQAAGLFISGLLGLVGMRRKISK